MGSLKVDFRILKELADVIAKSLSMVFENSWCSGEDPTDWEKWKMYSIFKKWGRKEDLFDYTCHIHLCAWEGHGADPNGNNGHAHASLR